jgi:hypothetical protein
LSVDFPNSKVFNWLIGMIPLTIQGKLDDDDLVFRINRIIDVVMNTVIQKLISIPLVDLKKLLLLFLYFLFEMIRNESWILIQL